MAREELLAAIAVTAELTGTELSLDAARVMAEDLSGFAEPQVLGALVRCRRELRGRMTIADVIARLDDGRPGPEEAWAMIPKDEYTSVVWSAEMRAAYDAAAPLINSGDLVAARMAFLESYRKHIADARAERREPVWTPSLGWDVRGREVAVKEAEARGRIGHEQAEAILIGNDPVPEFLKKQLPNKSAAA